MSRTGEEVVAVSRTEEEVVASSSTEEEVAAAASTEAIVPTTVVTTPRLVALLGIADNIEVPTVRVLSSLA